MDTELEEELVMFLKLNKLTAGAGGSDMFRRDESLILRVRVSWSFIETTYLFTDTSTLTPPSIRGSSMNRLTKRNSGKRKERGNLSRIPESDAEFGFPFFALAVLSL
jgi:hypothetical protein